MKRLDIITRHENLVEVNKLLHKHMVGGMSFSDIKGRGRSRPERVSVGRGAKHYFPEFTYSMKIEVVVPDGLAKVIIDDLLKVLGSGTFGIGKIFVYDVTEAYDLETKGEGESAL